MEKKNTVLLTVIAVATLLVAVVGSTFAFFAIQETNTANVEVKAETAAGSDIFSATGSGNLMLDVTNDVMMESAIKDEEGNNTKNIVAVSDTDSSMKISLQAGSGTAKCTYKLSYNVTEGEYTMTSGAADNKEYTLEGTDGTQSFAETNMDKIAELLAGTTYEISNTAGGAATEQTWTFTARFYNLAIDQATQMNQTHVGNVTVTDVVCENAGTTAE